MNYRYSYSKAVKERIKETLRGYDRGHNVGQDDMIDILEDITLELKSQKFMLPSLKQNLNKSDEELDQCEVDGCENEAENKIRWERPREPVRESRVCRTHYILDEVITENLGRFYSVITLDRPREKLKEEEII